MRRRFDPTLALVEFMIDIHRRGPRSITMLAADNNRVMPVVSRWIAKLEAEKMIELDHVVQRRNGGRPVGCWTLTEIGREFVDDHPVTQLPPPGETKLPRIVGSDSVDPASVAKPDGYFPF